MIWMVFPNICYFSSRKLEKMSPGETDEEGGKALEEPRWVGGP